MTAFWITGILMLLSLGAGLLVGTSWNIHALDHRYRRLAAERRELNEWSRELQEASWYQRAASDALAGQSRQSAATSSEGTLQDSRSHASVGAYMSGAGSSGWRMGQ